MSYLTVWLGCMIGIFLGITGFRVAVHEFKWPTIVGVSIAVIFVCVGYWVGYLLR